MRQLIVGVNGSSESRPALLWAAEQAARRKVTLVAVTVVRPQVWRGTTALHGLYETDRDGQRRAADARLRRLCAPLEDRGCAVEWEVITGSSPAHVLVDRARDTDGLVVGTRGRGPFAALLLGSLSRSVSVRPPCPITVVPGMREPTGKVVVGVDASAPARVALARAAEEARLRGATLEAVMVRRPPELPAEWSLPQAADGVVWIRTIPVATPRLSGEAQRLRQSILARWQSAAEQRLDREISALASNQRPDRIERLVISGTHPAPLLLQAASRADLLVVGSRGRGNVKGTVFGSVSHQCLRHASVPVMVVPSGAAGVSEASSSGHRHEVIASGGTLRLSASRNQQVVRPRDR